jgi:hypothetical protein
MQCRHTARGRSGSGGPVLRTCGASVESGILTDNKLVSNGSSRLASGSGSGLRSAKYLHWTYQAATEWQAASKAEYPCSKKIGAIVSRTAINRAGNGRWVRMTRDFFHISTSTDVPACILWLFLRLSSARTRRSRITIPYLSRPISDIPLPFHLIHSVQS